MRPSPQPAATPEPRPPEPRAPAAPESPAAPDPVEAASVDSFPASDPPSWTPLHVGEPHAHPDQAG